MVKAHKKKWLKTCFLDKTLPYKGPSFRLVTTTIHQCHWNAVTLERIDPIIPTQILHLSFKLEIFYDHKDNEPKTIYILPDIKNSKNTPFEHFNKKQ